ncbi:MAG: GNAT family N-acetyltransferase [Bdellovibrionales bacterium]
MPVLHIRALPQADPVKVRSALTGTCLAVAKTYGCKPEQVWATWEEIRPGLYAEGENAADRQPDSSHPPIVELIGFEGKSSQEIENILVVAGQTLSKALEIPGNIFITYREALSGRVIAGNGIIRKQESAADTNRVSQSRATRLQPRLESDRLILEAYTGADIEDVFSYASHPEVTRFLTWSAHKTLDDSRNFLDWVQTSTRYEVGALVMTFAIRSKQSKRVMGSIGFRQPQPWVGQIDYVLGRDHWGKGLMTEAACTVRDWALNTLPEIVRFQAYCQPENVASTRVMQKLGMTFEGILKKSFKAQGKIVDLAHYAWTRDNP